MTTASDPSYPAHWEADVVLRDGGTARIRPITTEDAERLVSFYEQVSDESKYYRFFAPYPRLSDRDVHRFTHHDYVDRVGLAATIGGEFIGTVRYDRIGADGRPASGPADEAEVAFLVQDAHQGRGVASALLEHIGAVARERGIRRFAAEVLPANSKMIKVFTDAGYQQRRSFEDGAVRLTLDLEPTAESLAVQRAREQRAEARSVQRLLAPGSVAVIGVSRSGAGMGAAALRNLRDSGFHGHLYAVNEAVSADLLDGVRAYRALRDIGAPVDLAVVAVPAERVPEVVAACGEHGVQGLVVLSAGYGESGPEGLDRQRELVRQVRSYGIRLIGPNAFGVINTAPEVELNASLAPAPAPDRGRIGLFTQSGAIGIALLSALVRRGEGLSSFVSAGNRADVSGNDILQYWYEDEATDVALLYLETLGNPRKFTRLARRTAAVKPVVVAKGGRHTPAGHVVPGTRLSDGTVSALLRQAGVIRVDTVTELVDVGLLLAGQPLPAGPRVAILGNSESLGVLTYDACLTERLRPLPPLDLTTAAGPAEFRAALTEALASPENDAVIVTAIPWVSEHALADDLADALRAAAAAYPGKPVAVVHVELGALADALSAATAPAGAVHHPAPPRNRDSAPDTGPRTPDGLRTGRGEGEPPAGDPDQATAPARIPAYPAAERAVRAVAEAVRYGQWRRANAEAGQVPAYDDLDESGAAAQLARLLAPVDRAAVVTLEDTDAHTLLGRYGIRVLPVLPAPTPDAAARAAAALGYPVALKTTAPHLRHRADLGGVRLDLTTEAELRRAYDELTEAHGKPAELLPVVQSMVPRGVDTVVRSVIDPAAGAVLSFGLAGVASELLGDTAHRLVPATDRDVAALIRSIRTAPLLFGWRGTDPVDTPALEELLLRLSRLVDDHPEVVGVSLEPVVVATEGLSVLSAAVRIAHPPARTDLGPRTLPSY
ncbi:MULTISPECIES: GNAT family N-acetyltransferase [unclassified Streptomyces]|uniref:bifunctional acetate--CoA ligase family protein/GNAT family N-acetyltransferase n=1 Tax=unclassified Streptomyces TaxID=2593676 RepID=UPI001BEB1D89|nr:MULTISPECIES: GNAT family N-acetyltransferase [unclassified Streptomyces]MBT2407915.1 GNAT family N-acetyltransferase [Streptomyces sp. ISL-21]MBT2455856.1 GNAT family N-acetyltransferase [Streptomyces sp. ISL-86]MBT2613306.1 GNAT family N-acetyltransferase [Streptomyces sp. ISL-87]